MSTTKPRRRVEINLRLGADSWDDAADALRQLSLEIQMGYCRGNVVSGGYTDGYTLESSEDESVTHDSYIAALNEYLKPEEPPCD